jgi:head-tail adaptor
MIHTLAVERAVAGPLDEYGQPTLTWPTIAMVSAFVTTKSEYEVALQSQGGAVISTVTIGVSIGVDVVPADRLRHDPAICKVAVHDLPARLYELQGARDASGAGIYLRCAATEIG